VELARYDLYAAGVAHGFFVRRAACARRQLLFHRAQLLLQLLLARQQFFEPLDRRTVARTQLRAYLFENLLALANRLERALPRHRLDSPHSRGDSRFRLELENADIAGARDVRAAAQLDRKIAHPDHADAVAVLVAEKCERARLDGVVVRHLLDGHFGVLADARVDLFLDRRERVALDRPLMREVKTQLVGIDQRARLMHRIAQDVAQRVVQNVRRGMIQHGGVAPEAIDLEFDARATCEVAGCAAQNSPDMNDRAFSLARVRHFEDRARRGLDHSAVAD